MDILEIYFKEGSFWLQITSNGKVAHINLGFITGNIVKDCLTSCNGKYFVEGGKPGA